VSANQIVQNFLSAENFPEWKWALRPISTQEKFPRTENFPKISLSSKFFSDGKFVSANHILQNFLSAENFPEWKWTFRVSLQHT
jgi:hypothetical protein